MATYLLMRMVLLQLIEQDLVVDILKKCFKSDVKELTSDGMLPLVRKGYDMMMGDDDTTPEYSDLMRQGFWGWSNVRFVRINTSFFYHFLVDGFLVQEECLHKWTLT